VPSQASKPTVVVSAGTLVAEAVSRVLADQGFEVVVLATPLDFSRLVGSFPVAVVADVEHPPSAELLAMASYLEPCPTLVALSASSNSQLQWGQRAFVLPRDDDAVRSELLRAVMGHRPPE